MLKRSLRGTYVAVEGFHLDAYVTEQVFRYNNRATKDNPLDDRDRFVLAVSQISGKRLTYAGGFTDRQGGTGGTGAVLNCPPGQSASNGEAEALDRFPFFSASRRRFSSVLDTLRMLCIARVNRANSVLSGSFL